MTTETGEPFQYYRGRTGRALFTLRQRHSILALYRNQDHFDAVEQWCHEQFGTASRQTWVANINSHGLKCSFGFGDESMATVFRMRWC